MNIAAYSPAVQSLLQPDRLCELGPGHPNESKRHELSQLTSETLFGPVAVTQPDFAEACRAALWLYHDFQDESHAISQELSSAEGSYWHGILHRREPDYGNAAYWFRKVRRHPVFEALGPAAAQLADEAGGQVAIPDPWDPFWFIDFCETCYQRSEPGEQLARQIQMREWELLFAYCYERAVG